MSIRSDNADLRLTEKGARATVDNMRLTPGTEDTAPPGRVAGVVSDTRWARFQSTVAELNRTADIFKGFVLSPHVRRAPIR